MEEKKKITLRIPKEIYGTLVEKSKQLGISITHLIIVALRLRYDGI